MTKTIRVPIRYQEMLEKNCLSSAGPNASVSGMKKKFWGKDAYVVLCGQYAYNVSSGTYYTCLYRTFDY